VAPAGWRARLAHGCRTLLDVLGRIRSHPYPIVIAALTALVYYERQVVHHRLFSSSSGIWDSALRTSALSTLVLAFGCVLAALLLDRRVLEPYFANVRQNARDLVREIVSMRSVGLLCSALFLLAIVKATGSEENVLQTLRGWAVATWIHLRGLTGEPTTRLIAALIGLNGIGYLIYRTLRNRTPPLSETVYETLVSAGFVCAFSVFYVWLNLRILPATMEDGQWKAVAGGLVKDAVVYSVFTLAIVIGTYKMAETLHLFTTTQGPWLLWGFIVVAAILAVIPALTLDLFYREVLLERAGVAEYPQPWQRGVIRLHIMVRDFGVMVPVIVIALLRLLSQVLQATAKLNHPASDGTAPEAPPAS
jgi:hypothetical protein